ncbi:hypothetical protein [Streptomyces sp. NPDC051561]|uniref:hypothetical protein n=1 Tax=Streptomyces sp. NPDC051561 TaxID=3365658 RepID=UPI0037878BA7
MPRTFGNCHYSERGNTAYCELHGPFRPGQGYAADADFRALKGKCCRADGFYRYRVSALEQLSGPEVTEFRALPKGSGRTLALAETDASALTNTAEVGDVSFRSQDVSVGVYFSQRAPVVTGTVGGRVELEVPMPTSTSGFPFPKDDVRVELPDGVFLDRAPKVGTFPSEVGWCNPDDLTLRTVMCPQRGDITMLALRIDPGFSGAEGRISVPVPAGDTNPSDNAMPLKVTATGITTPSTAPTTSSPSQAGPRTARPAKSWTTHLPVLGAVALVTAMGAGIAVAVRRRRHTG